MASSYDNDLRLNEQGTGDNSGSWGTVTNLNLEMIAEAFSYGTRVIANAASDNITLADGALDADRSMYLRLSGGGQACTVSLLPNTVSKVWLIENATSATLTFTQGSGANVAVLAGQVKMIATDGAGTGAVVYDLLTDVNLAGTTHFDNIDVDGTTNLDAVDIDGAVQLDATLTVGANDQGYDVTLHGDTAARNVKWDSSADSLLFTDNAKAVFGAGDDLEIVHNGSYSLIKDSGTGNLVIAAADLQITNPAVDENLLRAYENGAVELYHNNAIKAATTATGLTVSGSVVDNLTRGSIKVGNSSGVFAPLAKGAAGTVLTSDGTDLSFAAAGGGSLVFIASSGAISNGTANVDFSNKFDASKFHHYKFMLKNVKPDENYVILAMQTSSDGGSNYLTGVSDYQGNGADQYAGMKISHYYIGQTHGASGEFNLYQPLDSGNPTMATGTGVIRYTSDNWYNFSNLNQNTFAREASTADNAVRFTWSGSGNFAGGEIQLYGIAKS